MISALIALMAAATGCGTAEKPSGEFQKETVPSSSSSTSSTGKTQPAVSAVTPGKVPAYEIYENKDPFKPLAGEGSTSQVVTTPSPTGTGTMSNQVRLVSIPLGTSATIEVAGTMYENLRAGDVFAGAFQLLSIGAGSVTILYGDNQYTLYLGETISVK